MNISSINGIETKNIQRINKIYTSQIKSVCGAEISMKPFKTLWSVGAGQSITLLVSGYSYKCTVDWGDGTSNYINSYDSANRIHIYSNVGEYIISIKGICEGWRSVLVNTDRLLITKVLDFGEVEFKSLSFNSCNNLNEINGQINGPNITDFSSCFYDNQLTSIPIGLFDKCTQVENFSLCFYYNQLTSIPIGLFDKCTQVKNFSYCFSYNNNLTSIPANLFDNNILVTSFNNCFYSNNLTSIPAGLFDKCTQVTNFSYCFYNNQLNSIPANLFDNNILVTNFIWCFYSNNLTSIPANLFDKCTQVTNFASCFGVNQLTSIPIGLFDKCTQVKSFDNCFSGNNLTSIPIGLFDKCTQVENFSICFYNNQLTSIPIGLFDKCTQVENFSGCFSFNANLKLNKYIFYSEGQQSTRFLNQSVNFGNCFSRSSYISPDAENGEAPDLWNCDFGTGTATKTSCFGGNGNNAITLTNYTSIPSEWK